MSHEQSFSSPQSVEDFRAALSSVHERIAAAAGRAGRDPQEVRLLPVSKTVSNERVALAAQAGCREFGENRVQELKRKAEELANIESNWILIGHLQTNKTRDAARYAKEFQALDSLRVAQALNRHVEAAGQHLDVYVQVNTSAEESKYGITPDETRAFLEALTQFPALRVQGLMTLAVFTPDESRVRSCFRTLRELRDQLRQQAPELIGPGKLSMGMSGDFELAIEEGATCVRVGQAIFGHRNTPDSLYWPTPSEGSQG